MVAALAAVMAAFAAAASADYGTGAIDQIELSANVPGTHGGGDYSRCEPLHSDDRQLSHTAPFIPPSAGFSSLQAAP